MSKLYSPEYLAYCVEQGVEPDSQVVQLFFSQGCRSAPDFFSPPAQKPVSELGGSGAGLVGNHFCALHSASARAIPCELQCSECYCCDTLPATMTGDAWEAAAHHVIAIREKRQSNGDTWRQIGQFLDSMPKAES